MKNESFFREEALSAKKNHYYGDVSINTPPSYRFMVGGSACIAAGIVFFFLFGHYSEKTVVRGYLNSTKGIIRIYSKKPGVLLKQWVREGDQVKKGDPLVLIGASNENQERFLQELREQKQRIEKEIRYKRAYLFSIKKLMEARYLSKADYHSKQEELLALENNKNATNMAILHYKDTRLNKITSPVTGIISNLIYHQGQYLNGSKLLLKIIPSKATLIAELCIPVTQYRFLNHQNRIKIRYDAYPYKRFGSVNATIQYINPIPLTDEEDDKPFPMGEPYYNVSARLENPFIALPDEKKQMQPGMTLSAVILGSKRKIWQWMLDPFQLL